jgi:putative membrane protein
MLVIGKSTINLRNLLVRFLINAAAIFVADALVEGIAIEGWQSYAVMAIVFGLINAFAKPFLTWVTCPLVVLTLGIFLLVLNAMLFGLAAWLSSAVGADVNVDSFWAAFLGAIIVSIVSWLLSMIVE